MLLHLPFSLDFGIDFGRKCFKILASGTFYVEIEGAIAACFDYPNLNSFGKLEVSGGCTTIVDAIAPTMGSTVCKVLDDWGINNPKWLQGFLIPSVGFGVSQYCETEIYKLRNMDPPIFRDSAFASLLGQANINIDILWILKIKVFFRERIVFVFQGPWWQGEANDDGFQFYIEIKLGLEVDIAGLYQFEDEFNAAPGSEDDDTPSCGAERRYYVKTSADDKHHLMHQMPGSFRGKKARTPAGCTERMACKGWDFDPSHPLNFIKFLQGTVAGKDTRRPDYCQYGNMQPLCGADFGPNLDGETAWKPTARGYCTSTCYGPYLSDGDCDDGGPGAEYDTCKPGCDPEDCGTG